MALLDGKVALVTGASRGIGKGTALALAKEGATVYFTGRTTEENTSPSRLAGSLVTTENEIREAGGHGIAIPCDHTVNQDTARVFERIGDEAGRLDLLVNCAWGGYEHFSDGTEFWKEEGFWDMPLARWDKMFDAGVRAHFVASSLACKLMIARNRGLIVNLSHWAADRNDRGTAYSVAKAATNKMTECMAFELRDKNVAVVTLYPGLVRTESVMLNKAYFDLSNSESPEFTGRVVCRLLVDDKVFEKSGRRITSAELAIEYNVQDIDGRQPVPLTVGTC